MKILLLTVRSDFGGGPRHVNQLVEQLPNNIEIYLGYPLDGDPYALMWKTSNRIKASFNLPYRKFSLSVLFNLIDFVKINNIEIIHSHGNGAGVYSRIIKRICKNVKVIHTYHGISDEYGSWIKGYINNLLGRILNKFSDIYICVSNGEKQLALKRHFSKDANTFVIYNGIPNPHVDAKQGSNKQLKIVTLSRFDYPKNMEGMYKIASYFKNDKSLQFVWIGDGPDKSKLEEQAKKEGVDINFVGFSKEPMKYLLESDLYLSTSRFEGLPYGLIEAASVGLPIIASNVKGNNEVVNDKKRG